MAGADNLAGLRELFGGKPSYSDEVLRDTLRETSGDVGLAFEKLSQYEAPPSWSKQGKKKSGPTSAKSRGTSSSSSSSGSGRSGASTRGRGPSGGDRSSAASRPAGGEHRGTKSATATSDAAAVVADAARTDAADKPAGRPGSRSGRHGDRPAQHSRGAAHGHKAPRASDVDRSSAAPAAAPAATPAPATAPAPAPAPAPAAAEPQARKDAPRGQSTSSRGRATRHGGSSSGRGATAPAPAASQTWANIVKAGLPAPVTPPPAQPAPPAQQQQQHHRATAPAPRAEPQQQQQQQEPSPAVETPVHHHQSTVESAVFNSAPAPDAAAAGFDKESTTAVVDHAPSENVANDVASTNREQIVTEPFKLESSFFQSDIPLFTSADGFQEVIADDFRFGSFIEDASPSVDQQDHADKRDAAAAAADAAVQSGQLPPAQQPSVQQLQAPPSSDEAKSGVRPHLPVSPGAGAGGEMFAPHPPYYLPPPFSYPSYPDSPLPGAPTTEGATGGFHYMPAHPPPHHVYYPYGIPPPYSYNQYRPAPPGHYFPPKFPPAGIPHHPFPAEEPMLPAHMDYPPYAPGYPPQHAKGNGEGNDIAHPQPQPGQPPASHASRFESPAYPYSWGAAGQPFP